MKKYTIKEFAEGKKAVKIENEEQWNKLNKVHKLCGCYGAPRYYTNRETHSYILEPYLMNNWEVLEFSQLDFEDELVVGKWYKTTNEFMCVKYIKYLKTQPNGYFYCSEYISNDYYSYGGTFGVNDAKYLVEVSLEEIKQYLPPNHSDLNKKDTFVLPENWVIKITSENKAIVNEWKVKQFWDTSLYSINYDYVAQNGCGTRGAFTNEQTKITFEQFQQYVLKTTETMENQEWYISEKLTKDQFDELTNLLVKNGIQPFKHIKDVSWDAYFSTSNGGFLRSQVKGEGKTGFCVDNNSQSIKTRKTFNQLILELKEKTMEKEIIGYKLVKPKYEKAAVALGKWPNLELFQKLENGCNFSRTGGHYKLFKEAGVLDLWFEPVYKEEFKVGDWIYTISGNSNDSTYSEFKKITRTGDVFQIDHFSKQTYSDKYKVAVSKQGNVVYIEQYPDNFRLATTEEIKAAQIQLPIINGYSGSYENGIIKYGCAEFMDSFFIDLQETLDYRGNRNIKSIELSSGVKISIEQVKQIVEYINNK